MQGSNPTSEGADDAHIRFRELARLHGFFITKTVRYDVRYLDDAEVYAHDLDAGELAKTLEAAARHSERERMKELDGVLKGVVEEIQNRKEVIVG
ncbi:MAG TPA: hypothetical protein VMW19_09135 [Myxococcota bacterium]|nr:hypothetical protein [Myxococcota bacterium]